MKSDVLPTVRTLESGYKFEHVPSDLSLKLDVRGRWQSYRTGFHFYRRCMNGDVVTQKGEQRLNASETDNLLTEINRTIKGLLKYFSLNQRVCSVLQSALCFDSGYYRDLADQYRTVYPEDVPILPPDHYGDLVVQPATGCPNRRCTFCAFYKDKPFKVLSSEEFEQHLSGIESMLGGQLHSRDGLFIGSANAMALSQRRLVGYLNQIDQRFGSFKRGIAAFADPDFSAPRNAGQWQELAELGVTRLVIGLETGWDKLRGRLGKSSDLTNVVKTVEASRQAGMSVGITVLTGASQSEEAQQNLEESGRFIARLGLLKNDIVYLSPLERGSTGQARALAEQAEMKNRLAQITAAKVVGYQMKRFRYYC